MLKQNLPNAGKLVNSLRSAGYDNSAAICDLIDNGLDAEATVIKVDIRQRNNEVEITVADNGIGMDEKTLNEALKLGSLTDRNVNSDLGKYGMGLVTASWSMCKKISVFTKQKNNNTLKNEIDIDTIQEKNDFVCDLDVADEKDIKFFKEHIDNGSGTIVLLSKCDRIQNKNLSIFADKVRRDISRIYRFFIDSGTVFIVNGKEAQKIDPLMLDNSKTEIFSDEKFDVFIREKNLKETIRVKIAILPPFAEKVNASLNINQYNQGFYVLRNNREIASGITMNLFTKHNSLNRVRIEIFFSGNLDEEMGVNFIKQNVTPNQQILDKLREEVKGQIDTIKRRIQKENYKDLQEGINHDNAERIIASNVKLLITPQAEIEKRAKSKNKAEARKQLKEAKERIRKQFNKVHLSKAGLGCKFLERPMGEGGPIFEADQQGKLILIEWNSDHPFYKKFVLENKDNQEITTATDLLVYAMATAELKTFNNEENLDLLLGYKTVISSNLRTLLS